MNKLKKFIIKKIYQIFSFSGIQVPVRLYMDITNKNKTPAVIDLPPANTVMVLAPHMDDETIGCGGTLIKHVEDGTKVHVVFMTDGAAGFKKGNSDESSNENKIVSIRRQEAVKACEHLSIYSLDYLDLPDSKVEVTDDAIDKLSNLFEKYKPDLIYLPFLTDTHHDHWLTNDILMAMLKKLPGLKKGLMCCAYEVWNPIYPNSIVDISKQMDKKMLALQEYKSQLAVNNYVNSIKGLNAYRSIANHSEGYAEAFYLTTASEYIRLHAQMWSGNEPAS